MGQDVERLGLFAFPAHRFTVWRVTTSAFQIAVACLLHVALVHVPMGHVHSKQLRPVLVS